MKKIRQIKDEKIELSLGGNADDIIGAIEIILSKNIAEISKVNKIKKAFSTYVDLLFEWQKVHNLVSSRYGKYDMWENILDSIIFLSEPEINFSTNFVARKSIIDAGAGNGFPGIPLAIILNNITFFLVDTDRKKCSFLRMAKAKIGLKNIAVINDDIAKSKPAYFIITKAAFSPTRVGVLAEVLAEGGQIVIWGKNVEAFSQTLKPLGVNFSYQYDYSLPSGKQRSLLCFKKNGFSEFHVELF